MRPMLSAAVIALLALVWGCGGDGPVAAGPEEATLEFEDIAAAEIAATGFLDDLSDEDKAAVRAALQAARAEIRAIVASFRAGEIGRDEARAAIRAVHARLVEALGELLTDEQIERLLRNRPGDGRPDLDLTEEQIAAIRELRAEFHAFVRDVRARVESGELSAEEGRRLVRAEAHETRREICAILTPSQQAKVPFCRGSEEAEG